LNHKKILAEFVANHNQKRADWQVSGESYVRLETSTIS